MVVLLSILPIFLCLVLGVFLVIPFKKKKNEGIALNPHPKVSVLVAARNEENLITLCLQALASLQYPHVEILIGNDRSEDNTVEVIQQFIADKPQFQLYNITENIGAARGKSNVLAQLAHKAGGDFLFITDADTQVPKQWIEHMLAEFDTNTGVVTGVTTLQSNSWFGHFQQIDWLYALNLVKTVSDAGFPVTSMGNNMAMRKAAYLQTGGYEQLPFSITEDFQLFQEIIKQKWNFVNAFHADVLATSYPQHTWGNLLHQRKRWMRGAMELPWYFLLLLLAQALYYPATITLTLVNWPLGILLISVKTLLQTAYIRKAYLGLKTAHSLHRIVMFEFYSCFVAISLLLFYFVPIKVKWKGRTY